MPRAAPAGAYPAARLNFCRRDGIEWEGILQKAEQVQACVGGMIGLMEISASMETTRIHDSLVSFGGGWNGVAGTRARARIRLLPGALCAAVKSRASRGRRVHCVGSDVAGNFKQRGMIFARRSMTASWVARNGLKNRQFNRNRGRRYRF